MSHFIDTQQAPYGSSADLSTRQRWEIAVGIIIAAALAVAAFAFVNRTESPVVEQVAQPLAQSHAAGDDLATRFTVSEAIHNAGADDLASRFTVSEAIRYAGADDLATRPVVVEAQSSAGSDDMATRLTGPRNAESDDLATR